MSFTICSKRQRIIDCNTHLLILGGPGAGKTTIALYKAKIFIESRLQKNQKILFLSFSRAAIRQIGDKAKELIPIDLIKRMSLQTYHSFCWEVLESYSYFLYPGKALRFVPPHEESVLENKFTGDLWNKGQLNLFQQQGWICFDLFAEKVVHLFNKSASILSMYNSKYPLIIVDEFQDSDQDQWNLVKILSKNSQVICLADAEQRIYEWRKSVSPDRIEDVKRELNPTPELVDFENENNRSPSNSISSFANSIFKGSPFTPDASVIVKRYPFNQLAIHLKIQILSAFSAIKKIKSDDITVAVLCRSNSLVRIICDFLDRTDLAGGRKFNPIRYSVLIDENAVIQAGLNIALLLEPPSENENEDIAGYLRRAANFYNSIGKATNIATATKLEGWANSIAGGKIPKTKCVKDLQMIRRSIIDKGLLIGDPMSDWIQIRKLVESSSSIELKRISEFSRQLRLLRRGSQIIDALNSIWRLSGTYIGAVGAFERAISQEMLSQNYMEPSGCLVMNMHKSKGKEFDAVILVENQYNSFISRDEPPYINSRRLLRVAITRARHSVCVLMEKANPSPIFNDF